MTTVELNEMEEAFDELLSVNAETLGPQFIVVNGKKHDAIIEEIASNDVIVVDGGGQAEGEQFRVKVRKREFSSMPDTGDPVKVRGRELEVLGLVVDRNGVEYEITVGELIGQ